MFTLIRIVLQLFLGLTMVFAGAYFWINYRNQMATPMSDLVSVDQSLIRTIDYQKEGERHTHLRFNLSNNQIWDLALRTHTSPKILALAQIGDEPASKLPTLRIYGAPKPASAKEEHPIFFDVYALAGEDGAWLSYEESAEWLERVYRQRSLWGGVFMLLGLLLLVIARVPYDKKYRRRHR